MSKVKLLLISCLTIVLLIFSIFMLMKSSFLQGKSVIEKHSELINAIHQNDTEKIQHFINSDYPLNFVSKEGYTPLETALNDHSLNSAILLLKNGARINKNSTTPLFVQITFTLNDYEQNNKVNQNQENLNLYNTLLSLASKSKENDINAKNELGNSAIHIAALKGNPNIIDYLLKLGANNTELNSNNETPLLIAIETGHIEAVQKLYQYHQMNTDTDANGNNIFILASMNGRSGIMNYLLKQGTQGINVQNNEGQTALMIAAEYGYPDIVSMLLQHGADAALKSKEGKTALDYAKHWNHEDVIEVLKSR